MQENPEHYDELYGESRKEIYWSAAKNANAALSAIVEIAETRKRDEEDVLELLTSHKSLTLLGAAHELKEAITLLYLVEQAMGYRENPEEKLASHQVEAYTQLTESAISNQERVEE